jgi:hypothetical protein
MVLVVGMNVFSKPKMSSTWMTEAFLGNPITADYVTSKLRSLYSRTYSMLITIYRPTSLAFYFSQLVMLTTRVELMLHAIVSLTITRRSDSR